jgi:hypothetical protein
MLGTVTLTRVYIILASYMFFLFSLHPPHTCVRPVSEVIPIISRSDKTCGEYLLSSWCSGGLPYNAAVVASRFCITAAYLTNLSATSSLRGKTPNFGTTVDLPLSHLWEIGCHAFALIHDYLPRSSPLDPDRVCPTFQSISSMRSFQKPHIQLPP